MGRCKYCGNSAGWFSSAHNECEAKHEYGLADFADVLRDYFAQRLTAVDVANEKQRLISDAYLSEDDICAVADKAIRQYTATIRRPISPQSMHLMDDLLNNIGVYYNTLNKNGAVDEFTQKLLRGIMVEYFTDQLDLYTAHDRCKKVLVRFPMDRSFVEDAYLYVLNKAATNYLKNGMLTNDEERKVNEYVNLLSLPINNLPTTYQESDICKLGQVAILKNIQQGVIPHSNVFVPIMLGKNESILWTFNGVQLYQEKVTKEWVGRSRGMSFRVMKGVYYRVGGSKGHQVEHSTMEIQGCGSLYVTNKNLVFYSQMKSVKIPFSKIVGITPYTNGIEVHKDGVNQKRIIMEGFDPWFIMNLLSNIGNI